MLQCIIGDSKLGTTLPLFDPEASNSYRFLLLYHHHLIDVPNLVYLFLINPAMSMELDNEICVVDINVSGPSEELDAHLQPSKRHQMKCLAFDYSSTASFTSLVTSFRYSHTTPSITAMLT